MPGKYLSQLMLRSANYPWVITRAREGEAKKHRGKKGEGRVRGGEGGSRTKETTRDSLFSLYHGRPPRKKNQSAGYFLACSQ